GFTNESQSSHLTRVTSSEEIVLVTGKRLAFLESKKPTPIATSFLLRFAVKHAGVSAEYIDQKLIEQEEFERKWPGTEGLRVVRQRYFVPELSDDKYPKLLLDVYEGLESDTKPML